MSLPKPSFEKRPGAVAAATARLFIVGTICVLQYWLLTATMEAALSGVTRVTLPAFVASIVLFALAAGLVWAGERRGLPADREPPPPSSAP